MSEIILEEEKFHLKKKKTHLNEKSNTRKYLNMH